MIENLLCFQAEGEFPERIFFTLLTPRVFLKNPNSRLYGYRMREYEDRAKVLADIEQCRISRRTDSGYIYPDLQERLKALRLNWAPYEGLLEPEMSADLDIVKGPGQVKGLNATILSALAGMHPAP